MFQSKEIISYFQENKTARVIWFFLQERICD